MKLSRLLEKARKRFSVPPADPSASASQGAERRRSARAPLPYPVELLDASRRPADGAVHLLDMSGVGIGISSSRDFRIGDAMGVSFNTGARVINARAKVRWARPEGIMTAYGLELDLGSLNWWDRFAVSRVSAGAALDPEDAVNLLLQFAAIAVAVGVLTDYVYSNPQLLAGLIFTLPWLGFLAAAALVTWTISRT
ncbi:MAG: PilZ domain-containing protein [Elusimicrobia bacterium]|nr:PilZ domain-containing protein [Elusimicrobiota bacterium]